MATTREKTDAKLKAIEKQIKAIYKKESVGINKDLNKYFAKFEEEDKRKQKDLKDGIISESEYKTWKKSLLITDEYRNILNKTSKQITKINKMALEYINEQMKDIYIMNYNESGKEIENIVNKNFI